MPRGAPARRARAAGFPARTLGYRMMVSAPGLGCAGPGEGCRRRCNERGAASVSIAGGTGGPPRGVREREGNVFRRVRGGAGAGVLLVGLGAAVGGAAQGLP